MPKLPRDLVKRTAFDSPLRRTAPGQEPAAAADVEAAPRAGESALEERGGEGVGGVVLPFARVESEQEAAQAASVSTAPPAPDQQSPAIEHRITVRIDDATRRALETECHRRRIAGEKVTVAEIARGILSEGTSRIQ